MVAGPLRLNSVCIRYDDATALDSVTTDIPAGSSVAIIGPNGSGKSTLLKAVAGLIRPDSGSIDRGGQSTAIVLQSTDVDRSVPLTVGDTVAMARYPHTGLLGRFGADDRQAVDDALRQMDLETLTNRQTHHLSGGQRQRTFVAQGLAQEADMLLLDEPLTGLDVVSRSLIADALQRTREAGRTVMITTHSFEEAEECDLVMLLATRCIAIGTPDEVFTEDHLRQAFGGRIAKVGDTLILDDPHHEHEHAH